MSDAIAHRGPDDEGTRRRPVGLGNRRLAIIDLSPAGHQPMRADGQARITYNGELYNFRELRGELEGLGHSSARARTPRSCCAPSSMGRPCLDRFNGMFALAIWDRRRRSSSWRATATASSRSITPSSGPLLLFGSEIKALLEHPRVRAEMSPPHLLEYFTFQNIFSDGTLFKGVKLLPRATAPRCGGRGGGPSPERYWDFDFAEDGGGRPRTRSTSRSSTGSSARR